MFWAGDKKLTLYKLNTVFSCQVVQRVHQQGYQSLMLTVREVIIVSMVWIQLHLRSAQVTKDLVISVQQAVTVLEDHPLLHLHILVPTPTPPVCSLVLMIHFGT